MGEPMERLVRSLKDDLDAAVAERDRLRAVLCMVQDVLDETVDTDERVQSHVRVQEILNSETRRAELIEAGRAADLESKTIAGEYRRRAETAEAERDRLRGVADAARRLRSLAGDNAQWRGFSAVNRAHEDLFAAVDQLDVDARREGT